MRKGGEIMKIGEEVLVKAWVFKIEDLNTIKVVVRKANAAVSDPRNGVSFMVNPSEIVLIPEKK